MDLLKYIRQRYRIDTQVMGKVLHDLEYFTKVVINLSFNMKLVRNEVEFLTCTFAHGRINK